VSALASRLQLEHHLACYHLRVLRANHIVSTRVWGRLHIYQIASPHLAPILVGLGRLMCRRSAHGAVGPQQRGGPRELDLRHARLCYDHLAGGVGVYLLDEMLRRNWLSLRRDAEGTEFLLSRRGAQALIRRRVNVLWAGRMKRRFAYGCADWTEPHRHLGGALGTAVLDALFRTRVLRRVGGGRRVEWRHPLSTWLGAPERRVSGRPRLRSSGR